jgi:RimJ/RimL family protein N-acetyltransferase
MMPRVPSTRDDVSWPVRTERLTLRPATPEDAEATWAYRTEPSVARWTTRLAVDREEYGEWYASPEWLDSRVVIERDGVLIGELALEVKDGWAQVEVSDRAAGTEAEIGWVLAPEHQGQGLGREAVEALLAICFEQLGLRRVVAGMFADNEASRRLAERVGMRREAHKVRDSLHRELGWLDGFEYALLAEEWAARES